MSKHTVFIPLLLVLSLAQAAFASDQATVEQWDKNSAMAAVRSVNFDPAVDEIGNLASLADGATTLSHLKDMESRSDWPLPAREAAIYQFTRSLAELPRAAVAREIIQHLLNYQPKTLVPHEDHGDAFIPLFNIRAAATGVENGWQRAEFATEAVALLEADPTALVSTYSASVNQIQRSGYLDALAQAAMHDIMAVQNVVLKQLDHSSVLTPLLAVTTTITTDTFAIQQLLVNGRGAGLSSALVQLDKQLPLSETSTLLSFAVEHAPPVNTTLAIAAWWPRLRHDSATRELLLDTLADPALGASAALALAQSPDVQTIKVLQDTANGTSDAARRAQMALDFNRDGLSGGDQP